MLRRIFTLVAWVADQVGYVDDPWVYQAADIMDYINLGTPIPERQYDDECED